MDPVSLLIMCLVISAVFVGKTTTNAIHAARGTMPASLEKTRAKLAAEQHRLDTLHDMAREGLVLPEDVRRPYGWSNVLDDALNLSAMWVGHALKDRQDNLAKKWQQRGRDAEDRLADDHGLGKRGSADAPATSAPDALDGDATEGEGGPRSDGEPTTPPADTSTGAPTDTSDGDRCDFAEMIHDEGRHVCERNPAVGMNHLGPGENHLKLCTMHLRYIPEHANTTQSLNVDSGRCHFVHKQYTHAVLRCAHVSEPKAAGGENWQYCVGHREADPEQVAAAQGGTRPKSEPAADPEPAQGEPEPAARTAPYSVPAPKPCGMREFSAFTGVYVCDLDADPTSRYGLCGHHNSEVPYVTDLDRGTDPRRCTWTHKELDGDQRLRCMRRPDDQGGANPLWDRCRNHTVPDDKSAPPKEPPGPCNWKAWAGPGVTSFCLSDAHESSVAGLCMPHEQLAPQVSSLTNGAIDPSRCDWEFKQLPFGALRCIDNAVGGSEAGEKSRGCTAHGGELANGDKKPGGSESSAADSSSTDQKKEEADGPTNKAACTGDMSCTTCVLVDGKPTCLRDLPDTNTTTPTGTTPELAQDDPSSNATGENMTSPAPTTVPSAGAEAATLGGAKAYIAALKAEVTNSIADIDTKIGTMRGAGGMNDGPTFAALEQVKDGLNGCLAKCDDAVTALSDSMDGLKEGFEANPEAGTKEFITGE